MAGTYSNQRWQRTSGEASSGVSLKARQARVQAFRAARKSSFPAGKDMAGGPSSLLAASASMVKRLRNL